MKLTLKSTLSGLVVLAGAGCTQGPNYHPPQSALAPAFSELPKPAAPATASRIVPGVEAVARWWLVFGDDELNSLIARAVRENVDLKLAVSRVREARARRSAIGSGLGPQVAATAGYNRGRGSQNVVLPLGGNSGGGGSSAQTQRAQFKESAETSDSGTSGSGSGTVPGSGGGGAGAASSPFGQGGLPGVTTNLYQVGFDASWELDVFGGTRRAIEASSAGLDAAEEAYRGALVSLLGEVATTYVDLRTVQQRLRIARENLSAQRDALDIARAKFKDGFGTDLDVDRQSAEVFLTEATIPTLEAAERSALHALAFLLGARPDALSAELEPKATLVSLPAEVPVGVPSDLLRRRPDIRRAERALAAATAQVGVAAADWWPKFSLTGSFGFDSSDVTHLGDWQSHYYSIAPGIRWPILDWGRIRANGRIVDELQQQAFLSYTNAVSGALRDVENALVGYEKEQARRNSLASAVAASRRSRLLAQQNYEHGLTDLLVSLDAQRSLLQAEDALAQSDNAVRRDLVSLYKALGGGWE